MEPISGYSEHVTAVVTGWSGVRAGVGQRGEWAFKVGGRELGHLHGDHVAHFAFPRTIWEELYAAGRITHHPIFPEKVGWAERRMDDDDDVRDVVAILRYNYERAIAQQRAH